MSEPIGYVYRSVSDERYYIFCPGCWKQMGKDYIKRSQRKGEASGVWAIYSHHLPSEFFVKCIIRRMYTNCSGKIGEGGVDLFENDFLRDAYRDPELKRILEGEPQ